MDKSQEGRRVRVMLVDDHRIVREGLRSMLVQQADMEVVADAGDGRSAVDLAVRLRPDVVVMDVELPEMNGVQASREILRQRPEIRIVMLSAGVDRTRLDEAIRAGVVGYLLKINATEELVHAIRRVMRGESFVCREVSAILVGGYRELLSSSSRRESDLSPREVEVLKLIAAGRNTKEIAGELGLSVKTIESHRTRIMTRLGLNGVAELTRYAIRHGLTEA